MKFELTEGVIFDAPDFERRQLQLNPRLKAHLEREYCRKPGDEIRFNPVSGHYLHYEEGDLDLVHGDDLGPTNSSYRGKTNDAGDHGYYRMVHRGAEDPIHTLRRFAGQYGPDRTRSVMGFLNIYGINDVTHLPEAVIDPAFRHGPHEIRRRYPQHHHVLLR